ncbi:MAG: restriction endonuclease subunit S [Parabacteroides sp.]|nr:restriction endonuclease subunit S [Parabacteroides sp.]MDY4756139.1 restriction endonuclease subunit S [Parabacteroides sp.]
MRTGVVSFKNITTSESIHRLDAPIYMTEGVLTRKLVAKSPYPLLTIGDVSKRIWHAGRWRRVYVTNPKHGITLLGSSAILKADVDNEKLVSIKYTDDIEDKILKAGWTLISCSGTIGNCAFANAKHAEKLASQDVIRLSPNNILRGGLVYAYLASKYGYAMLTQGTFGSVIQHIEPQNVESIPIPSFPDTFQKEVDDLIQESARLREEAAEALDEAKAILTTFIGDDFNKVDKKYVGKVSINSIRKTLNNRFDPPVYINKGVSTVQNLSCKTIPLGECNARFWYPGIFKRAYVKEGLPYIKGSSLFEINPFKRCDYLSRSRTPGLEDLWLKEGQILMSCAGICGQVKLITKEYEDKKAIGSPDIIRIHPMDVLYTKEYLFAYLQLPFVYDYMQSLKYGSVIERFDIDTIKTIPVVTPTRELSEEITGIIKLYIDCTYRAFNAEEKAIRMVEEEIEKWNK